MKMRLGMFGFAKDIDAVASAGFDCIEMHYKEIMGMRGGEIRRTRQNLKSAGITAEVFNNPIPLDARIASNDFDTAYYRDYMKEGAEKAAELGARFCNFGNGKTRSLPEGASAAEAAEAEKKITECVHTLCEINAQYNITVLIEPLSATVSNFIHSIPEALKFIESVGCSNAAPFVDLRWHLSAGRPMEEIVTYRYEIAHIHIDNPLTEFPVRLVPKADDQYDYSPFFDALKAICYKGIISCEANTFADYGGDIKNLIAFFNKYDIQAYK